MTLDLGDLASLITALVAIAGLGLSIYNFFVAKREKSPQLRVKLSNGLLVSGPDLSETMLIIEVANPGTKPVIINSVAISFKGQIAIFPGILPGTHRVPFELEPGKNATFWTPLSEFASSLLEEGARGKVKLRARVSSATGDYYLSNTFTLDVDRWAGYSAELCPKRVDQ